MAKVSNLLLLGFSSGTLQILDIKIGKYLDLQSNYEHTQEVTCADFADRMGLFATGSLDCKVKIWNYQKDLMRELAMTQPIRALRFLDSEFWRGEREGAVSMKGRNNSKIQPQFPETSSSEKGKTFRASRQRRT